MLETIWFALWALLWAVYFVLDGFDLGLGALMPFIADNETERRIIYNASGPFWDGNEVWLIAAGGVTFAAFPRAYAVMFSALYAPLLLLLFALILRAVSYEFRNKVDAQGWRRFWDGVHYTVNLAACVLLGVFFANLFKGIPVSADGVYHGNILRLLNPYGLVGGLLFLAVFVMHGAIWLALKSRGRLQIHAVGAAGLAWPCAFGLLCVFLVLTFFYTGIYGNYLARPYLLIIPAIAITALLAVPHFLGLAKYWCAWWSSAVFIVGFTFFGVCGIYPDMIISSIAQDATITAFNGASTTLTLEIMLGVALVMVPIVLIYQFWMYRLFSHPVTEEVVNDKHAY